MADVYNADKTIILIGPAVPAVRPQMDKLLAAPNVQHLGVVKHDRDLVP